MALSTGLRSTGVEDGGRNALGQRASEGHGSTRRVVLRDEAGRQWTCPGVRPLSMAVLAPGDVVDLRQLDGERAPEDAAVARDVEPVAGAVEDMVGVLAQRDGATLRQPRATLRPRGAPVAGDDERRLAVEEQDEGRAARVDVEDPAGCPRRRQLERALALHGRAGLAPGELVLVRGCAHLDEVRPVVAAGEDDQRAGHLPRSALTAPLASRAAETGECRCRRYVRYAAVHESPAPVGSTPASGKVGMCSARPSA